MVGGLSVFVLVALPLLCVALGASASASERRVEVERRHAARERRPFDQQFDLASGVGHSIGRDTAPGPPQAVGATRPAGGVPDAERRPACVGGRRG